MSEKEPAPTTSQETPPDVVVETLPEPMAHYLTAEPCGSVQSS